MSKTIANVLIDTNQHSDLPDGDNRDKKRETMNSIDRAIMETSVMGVKRGRELIE